MRTLCLLGLAALVGCKKGTTELEITSAADILKTCEDRASEIKTESVRIEFGTPEGDCGWGENGNLTEEDGTLTARIEQTESLGVPDDVLVCDMLFAFAGEAGLEQDIEYDDNFIFVFDGVVLASSYRPWIDLLETENDFPLYDWATIAGQDNAFDNNIPTFCLGEDQGMAECDIPPPETTGPIRISFDTELTAELSFRAIESQLYDFTFITTGDNDASTDCSHEPFFFDVEVPYLDL